MRRWGQIPESKPDAWYVETAKKVYRAGRVSCEAAKAAGRREEGERRRTSPSRRDGFRAPTKEFIDGVEYDGRKPNAYIEKLAIGLKGQQKIEGGNVVGK